LYRTKRAKGRGDMNKEELKKYFEQQLSSEERYEIEKQSQLDPFDYEAMAGYEQHGFSDSELKALSKRLEDRVLPNQKRNAAAWWKIGSLAAGIGIVIGLISGWLIFGLRSDLTQTEISQLQEIKKEDKLSVDEASNAPVLMDSVKSIKAESEPVVSNIDNQAVGKMQEINQPVEPTKDAIAIENTKSTIDADAEITRKEANIPKSNLKSATTGEGYTKEMNMTSADLAKSVSARVKVTEAPKPVTSVSKSNVSAAERSDDKVKTIPVSIAKKEEKKLAKPKSKEEPDYKNAGESITLGGLADMLKQEKNETVTKADGNQAPSIIVEEKEAKKSEPFKYDYDKAEQNKVKAKSIDDGGRKKSKIQIPLDALPINITFEDYVKIKLRDKAFKCPKKGNVKLIVNLDKNKKIEDFTIMEVNNKICVDYAKAILEEWISEKSGLYDAGTAYQFIVSFN
jgi:hypothetical protein